LIERLALMDGWNGLRRPALIFYLFFSICGMEWSEMEQKRAAHFIEEFHSSYYVVCWL